MRLEILDFGVSQWKKLEIINLAGKKKVVNSAKKIRQME